MMYMHKEWPRALTHKESGATKTFNAPEDVPPGWFTADGEEVNPSTVLQDEIKKRQAVVDQMLEDAPEPTPEPEAKDDASEQALRTVRGGGSDPKPRGKGRKRGHPKSDGGNPSVPPVEE